MASFGFPHAFHHFYKGEHFWFSLSGMVPFQIKFQRERICFSAGANSWWVYPILIRGNHKFGRVATHESTCIHITHWDTLAFDYLTYTNHCMCISILVIFILKIIVYKYTFFLKRNKLCDFLFSLIILFRYIYKVDQLLWILACCPHVFSYKFNKGEIVCFRVWSSPF